MGEFKSCGMIGLSQLSNNDLDFSTDVMRDDTSGLPHIYASGRSVNSNDMKELERSAIVTIEKNSDCYVCIHNVQQLMTRNKDVKPATLKWRPYDDTKFLVAFDMKELRDKFLSTHPVMFYSDAAIKFKPFQLNEQARRSQLKFKVWLVIRGLPVQHLCYRTAELVASRFGRLYACDMETKEIFVGAFRMIIDCNDISGIDARAVFHFEDDGETIIHVQKEYLCTVEHYNGMKFDEEQMTFQDVTDAMLEAKKLTALN